MRVLKEVEMIEEDVDYVQRLGYLREGYKVLMSSIMSIKKFSNGEEISYNEEIYKAFMRDYLMTVAEYELVMNEMTLKYCGEFSGRNDVSVNINFNTCLMTISEKVVCHKLN